MDKHFLPLDIAELRSKFNVEPLSREFIFGPNYAKHRNLRGYSKRAEEHISVLQFLLREEMTEDHRKKIFSGEYDLGNMREALSEKPSYKKLADEMFGFVRHDKQAKYAFESIQNGIYQITGRKLEVYLGGNKWKALKVVKILKNIQIHRYKQIMNLLVPPEKGGNFSMSFRDAFSYKENKEQVWVVADLKAYLGLEIADELFEQIRWAFTVLEQGADEFVREVEAALVPTFKSNCASMTRAYETLTVLVDSFQVRCDPRTLPLDEELFIHLHSLEFSHYAIGYAKLVEEAVPNLKIVPVHAELKALARSVVPPTATGVSEIDRIIPLPAAANFCREIQHQIVAIVERALGLTLKFGEFDQVLEDVENVLQNYYWFRYDPSTAFEKDRTYVSVWHVVAAVCNRWYMIRNSSKFAPYWLGQQSPGKSIRLSIPKLFEDVHVESVPEEHRQILALSLEWFADALRGHAELKARRFAFRVALLRKCNEIGRTNNPDFIVSAMANLGASIRRSAADSTTVRQGVTTTPWAF